MRGGAIPLLAWGTLLLVLYIGNWVWDGTGVNPAVTGLAVLLIYAGAVALTIRAGRRAVQTGSRSIGRRPSGGVAWVTRRSTGRARCRPEFGWRC